MQSGVLIEGRSRLQVYAVAEAGVLFPDIADHGVRVDGVRRRRIELAKIVEVLVFDLEDQAFPTSFLHPGRDDEFREVALDLLNQMERLRPLTGSSSGTLTRTLASRISSMW